MIPILHPPLTRGRHGLCAVLALLLVSGLAPAQAGDHVQSPSTPAPPAYAAECGACHLAYPPGLLPAASWQGLMAGLPRHFGSDASLDEATTRQLADWLQANAATGRRLREPPPQQRITQAAWFQRKHREVEPAVWRNPSVRSAANCAACHPGAARGRFSEHELRWPAALDARYRRDAD